MGKLLLAAIFLALPAASLSAEGIATAPLGKKAREQMEASRHSCSYCGTPINGVAGDATVCTACGGPNKIPATAMPKMGDETKFPELREKIFRKRMKELKADLDKTGAKYSLEDATFYCEEGVDRAAEHVAMCLGWQGQKRDYAARVSFPDWSQFEKAVGIFERVSAENMTMLAYQGVPVEIAIPEMLPELADKLREAGLEQLDYAKFMNLYDSDWGGKPNWKKIEAYMKTLGMTRSKVIKDESNQFPGIGDKYVYSRSSGDIRQEVLLYARISFVEITTIYSGKDRPMSLTNHYWSSEPNLHKSELKYGFQQN